MSGTNYHDDGRYGVVRSSDAVGLYYAVVDKVEHRDVKHTRSRAVAHNHAAKLNGPRACPLCGGAGWTDSSAELRRDGRTGDTTCVACDGAGTVTR